MGDVDIAALQRLRVAAEGDHNPALARAAFVAEMGRLGPALLDEIERLRADNANLSAFAREFVRANCWEGYSQTDGGDVQDMALKHGIIVAVEGGYDPEKHGCEADEEWGMDRGDPYYAFAPFVSPDSEPPASTRQ